MKRTAFSLIEILCVIAIIASLASILLPVLMKAKERPKESVCLSNLSQIGKAEFIYSADYDDRAPYAITEFARAYAPYSLPVDLSPKEIAEVPNVVQSLMPYAKDIPIFRCPLDFGTRFDLPDEVKPTLWQKYETSYDIKAVLFDYALSSGIPSETILAEDQNGQWHSHRGATWYEMAATRLYADGHAKRVLLSAGSPKYRDPSIGN